MTTTPTTFRMTCARRCLLRRINDMPVTDTLKYNDASGRYKVRRTAKSEYSVMHRETSEDAYDCIATNLKAFDVLLVILGYEPGSIGEKD